MSERTAIPLNLRQPAWLDEFRAFIMRGNVVDLAVGIIIGVAFTAVVNSLVKDIFTPLIGLLVGGARGMPVDLLLDRGAGLADKVLVTARREIVAAPQQIAAFLEMRVHEARHQLVVPLGGFPIGPVLRQLA